MTDAHLPLRLTIDSAALAANWRWLDRMSGTAACGAAVKADGYGVGATKAAETLFRTGCRDFFVATWAEAEALLPLAERASLSVLHGVAAEDMAFARSCKARPVLNTPLQVQRWRETAGDLPCDVMIDTGMNRLGISAQDLAQGLLDDLSVETVMSHLASADEDSVSNDEQRLAFIAAAEKVPARRRSLANSAGICLGADFAFDLTRPGVALYGGVPRAEAIGHIAQVVRIEAQVIQRRRIEAGDRVGYNGTFTADRAHEIAILNIGYADGYLRGFSNSGRARLGGKFLPVVGRVSMDLTAICVDEAPEVQEGDWIEMDFDLLSAAAQSALSQYELLTILGARHRRTWTA